MPTSDVTDRVSLDDIVNSGDTGAFTVILASIGDAIQEQYCEGRITGSDFANVYITSIREALAASLQFALNKAKTNAEIDTEVKNRDLVDAQVSLTQSQVALNEVETELKRTGIDLANAQMAKIATEIKVANENLEYDLALKRAELELNGIEKRLAEEKLLAAIATTELTNYKAQEAKETIELVRANVGKATEETKLITARIATETEQLNVAKSQKVLYTAQSVAFQGRHTIARLESVMQTHTVDMAQAGTTAWYTYSENDYKEAKATLDRGIYTDAVLKNNTRTQFNVLKDYNMYSAIREARMAVINLEWPKDAGKVPVTPTVSSP